MYRNFRKLVNFNFCRKTAQTFTYGLLTKREVKMAGYWPSSFFCVFMDRDKVEVHKHAKKERGQYPAILTEQALVNKGFIIWDKTPKHDKLYLRDKFRIPSGQDSSILPARVANHSARFGSSCPLTELVI